MLKPGSNILILATQVPFSSGGAELLVKGLLQALVSRGYNADVIQLPFCAEPKDRLLAEVRQWRLLDVTHFSGRKVDAVICTKFPSYAVRHPNKRLWLIHQHRQLYELYGTRYGDFSTEENEQALREILLKADRQSLSEVERICCISQNVANRLKDFCGLDSSVLEPPLPLLGQYYSSEERKPYILSVGRLCSIKRVDLMLKALPTIDAEVTLKVVGVADEPQIENYLKSEIRKHHLEHRVEMLGRVGDAELLELFAESLAVYYAPFDEDYGFVTLEALLSGAPVLTATDSGSVRDYVRHGENGIVVEPNPEAIAKGVNELYRDSDLYAELRAGVLSAPPPTSSWDDVVQGLLSASASLWRDVSASV